MNKIVTSLAIVTGATTSLLIGNNAALAASFNWSYTTGQGDVYSGMLEGEQQGDEINVTSFFMSQLNGSDLPETPIVRNSLGVLGSTGVVSLDGEIMNLGACADTGCVSGIFIGDFGLPIAIQFVTTTDFGNYSEDFNTANWRIEEKLTLAIPEPSLGLALVGLGFSGLVKTFLKKG